MAKQFLAAFIFIAFACLLCFTTNSESRALANEENQVEPNQFPYVSINSEPVKPFMQVEPNQFPYVSINSEPVKPNQFPNVWKNSEPVKPSTYALSPPGIPFTLSDQQRDIVATNDALVIAAPKASNSLQVNGAAATTWCIVKPSTDEASLQQNIDYSCAHANCSIIKPGGACYEPKNIVSHASVAMNLFYKGNGKNVGSCDFTSSGLIIIQDPSVGQCKYDPS